MLFFFPSSLASSPVAGLSLQACSIILMTLQRREYVAVPQVEDGHIVHLKDLTRLTSLRFSAFEVCFLTLHAIR